MSDALVKKMAIKIVIFTDVKPLAVFLAIRLSISLCAYAYLCEGCAGVIVGHPFDTIKVLLQTQDAAKPKYRGTLDCMKSLVRQNGVSGLYRGMSSPLAGVAAINAIVFGVYGNAQRKMTDPDSLKSHMIAGAMAGIAQSFLCSPMELVKSRVQILGRGSPLQCLKDIVNSEGYRGIFRGLGITITREVPGFSSYFVTYELLTRNEDNIPVSTPRMLFAGGFAGCVSWFLTYPIDVIKSRLQVDGLSGDAKYSGAVDCLKKSVRAEGYGVLTRGLSTSLLRAFPMNAACFTIVTWTFRLFSSNNKTQPLPELKTESSFWENFRVALATFNDNELVAA